LTRCFEASSPTSEPPVESPCFWRPKAKGAHWKRRIHLRDLKVGQKLTGSVQHELLEGKTGPKVFFECGVGRTNSKGEWSIVNGMMRLDKSKASVVNKRAARVRKKDEVELYVSRVQLGCGRLEVCASPEAVDKYKGEPKVPVTSLKAGQEVKGAVVRLLPYGAMVDVGANRLGLLHISKVGDLYGRYIDKEGGLVKAGLERGAKVRLVVESNEKKRLFLDFTETAKASSSMSDQKSSNESTTKETQNDAGMSADELAAWAAYASGDETSEEVEEDEDDDDDNDKYDEENDIEDSMGLGSY
jgi:predicted RNA-binding protein with RPS1 domain